MKDIHDNLPPIQVEFLSLLDWVVLLLLVCIFIWLYIKFFYFADKKNVLGITNKKTKMKKVFTPFSFSKALLELQKIKKSADWKEFSLKATEILKLVLQEKYRQPFLFATGRELVEILGNKDISLLSKKELQHFFELLDPIKFAGRQSFSDAEEVINILKSFEK